MELSEFSNGFDTLVDSYRRFRDFDKRDMLDTIEFGEYEKSLYLTEAQDEVVVEIYSGRNRFGEAFETTEEMRRYLDPLVLDANCEEVDYRNGVSSKSVFYSLPSDLLFIVYERVALSGDALGCYDGSETAVVPVTHDEYNRIRKNPFRGSTKYRVLRLDAGQNIVELVSQYHIDGYFIRYVSQPAPIVLENFDGEGVSVRGCTTVSGCVLPEILHNVILRRAVQLALASKGIQANSQ